MERVGERDSASCVRGNNRGRGGHANTHLASRYLIVQVCYYLPNMVTSGY